MIEKLNSAAEQTDYVFFLSYSLFIVEFQKVVLSFSSFVNIVDRTWLSFLTKLYWNCQRKKMTKPLQLEHVGAVTWFSVIIATIVVVCTVHPTLAASKLS